MSMTMATTTTSTYKNLSFFVLLLSSLLTLSVIWLICLLDDDNCSHLGRRSRSGDDVVSIDIGATNDDSQDDDNSYYNEFERHYDASLTAIVLRFGDKHNDKRDYFNGETSAIDDDDDEQEDNQHQGRHDAYDSNNRPFVDFLDTKKFQILNMTLCQDKCLHNCKTYLTPMSICYSPKVLFPNDPSWSIYDIHDELLDGSSGPSLSDEVGSSLESSPSSLLEEGTGWKSTKFRRTIYNHSQNGTCTTSGVNSDPDDVFIIPLNECVGPFDQPRPWGIFTLI